MILFVALWGACVSCSPSPAKHEIMSARGPMDAMEPTRESLPNGLAWIAAREDEVYDKSFALKWGDPVYLSYQDTRTQQLQSWVVRLHNYLAGEYPERFALSDPFTGRPVIEPPVVRVMEHDTPNAFVSSTLVCYSVAVQFAEPPPQATEEGEGDIIMIGKEGVVGSFARGRLACVDRMMTPKDPSLVVSYLKNNTQLGKCELSVRDNAVVLGHGCRLSRDVRAKGAGGIALESVTNRITVTTGLMNLYKDESQLVYALLHELAHYYRSHGALDKSRFSFFYRQSTANWQRAMPLADPDPSIRGLGALLVKMPRYRTQPIEGQIFHSQMFSYYRALATGIVTGACGDTAARCHEACDGFMTMARDGENIRLFGRFPQARLSGEALERYRRYENETSRCLGDIKVANDSVPGEGVVSAKEAKSILWMAAIPVNPAEADYRMLDAFRAMSDGQFAADKRQNNLLQRALDERLGYYTTEEEADNYALSWLAAMGLAADVGIHHWLRYAESRDDKQQDSPFNYSYRRCRELYEAQPRWTENGNEISVPVGSFAEDHHSFCFRAYNLERRLAARATLDGIGL